jgi:Fic family protein
LRRDDLVEPVRQQLRRYPAPHDSHYGVVPLPPPEEPISLGDFAGRHQAASLALARIEAYAAELHDPYVVSRLLSRQEAVSSSAIEGTNSTLDELLSAEEESDADVRSATLQVRDYAVALERLIPEARKHGPNIFSVDFVRELHRIVIRGDADYEDVPGELRGRVVWIGGGRDIAYSTYNPTPPADVETCLCDTLTYMRADGPQVVQQSLLARMAIAHSHFEAVHPFRDGNGRVGRLLLPLMMAAENHLPLYLSPYIEANKSDYYAALKVAQQRLDWANIIGFMANAVVGTVDETMATRHALTVLTSIWSKRRNFRSGSAAMRSLMILPHYPVITTTRLATVLGVTFRAASLGIDQLVEAGILVERTGYRRNRIFVAPEALSIINRPFGAEAALPANGQGGIG